MDERRGLVVRRDSGEGCVDGSVSSTSNDRFSVGLVMPDTSRSVLLARALADLAGYDDFFMASGVSLSLSVITVGKSCSGVSQGDVCICYFPRLFLLIVSPSLSPLLLS